MRLILLVSIVFGSGCKSAEIAVNHQMTGLHVAAKFEAKDPAHKSHWMGGEAEALLRR